MKKMKIEIWSDIACPYCYIGKRKLENALAIFPYKEEIEIVWRSYELSPALTKAASGGSFYEFFSKNHQISELEARTQAASIVEVAKEVGLDYDFDHLIVANTNDALRLVKLASKQNLASQAEEAIFEAYFIDGKDVSDRDTLLQLGIKIGLEKDAMQSMLDSDLFKDDIIQDIQYSERELKLEYIPFYLFNKKQIIQGSISSEQYLEVLTKSFAEWQELGLGTELGDTISGQSCSIDGVCT